MGLSMQAGANIIDANLADWGLRRNDNAADWTPHALTKAWAEEDPTLWPRCVFSARLRTYKAIEPFDSFRQARQRLSVRNPQVVLRVMLAKIQPRRDRYADCFQQRLRQGKTIVRECAAVCVQVKRTLGLNRNDESALTQCR